MLLHRIKKIVRRWLYELILLAFLWLFLTVHLKTDDVASHLETSEKDLHPPENPRIRVKRVAENVVMPVVIPTNITYVQIIPALNKETQPLEENRSQKQETRPRQDNQTLPETDNPPQRQSDRVKQQTNDLLLRGNRSQTIDQSQEHGQPQKPEQTNQQDLPRRLSEQEKPGEPVPEPRPVDILASNGDLGLEEYVYEPKPTSEPPLYLRSYTPTPKNNTTAGTTLVALGLTLSSSPNITKDNIYQKLLFLNTLVPSFCHTMSKDSIFSYTFYVTVSRNDPWVSDPNNQHLLTGAFRKVIDKECSDRPESVNIKLIYVDYSGSPAWAVNDAMMVAYLDEAEYYYSITDDIEMNTGNWTAKFIKKLKSHFGAVAPNISSLHAEPFELNFVHRTHIDTFGFYYPRVFLDLYAHEWMEQVYKSRATRISDVKVRHTTGVENRFGGDRQIWLNDELSRDKGFLNRYMEAEQARIKFSKTYDFYKHKATQQVIAMSLAGTDATMLWGAIRNANIVKAFFPEWTLRFYVAEPVIAQELAVPELVLRKLMSLKAEIIVVPKHVALKVHYRLWKFLAIDDLQLQLVLFRDARSRLFKKDRLTTYFFQTQTTAVGMCICDQNKKNNLMLQDTALNIKVEQFQARLQNHNIQSVYEEIMRISTTFKDAENDLAATNSFLNDFLWKQIKNSCKTFGTKVKNFPTGKLDVHVLPPVIYTVSADGKDTSTALIGQIHDRFETLPQFLARNN